MPVDIPTLDLEQVFGPFRAQLGPYNPWLVSRALDGATLVAASDLLNPVAVHTAIEGVAQIHQLTDLRIAAVAWSNYYLISLVAPALLAMTLAGLGLDYRPDNVSLVINEGKVHGAVLHNTSTTALYVPRSPSPDLTARISHQLDSLDELHQIVIERLLRQHLVPLLELVHATTRVSYKILWGNLGNACHSVLTTLAECTGQGAAGAIDNTAFTGQSNRPVLFEDRNPLFNPARYTTFDDPAFPEPVVVRNTCCTLYRWPQHGYCVSCPILKPEARLARWNEVKAMQAAQTQKEDK